MHNQFRKQYNELPFLIIGGGTNLTVFILKNVERKIGKG